MKPVIIKECVNSEIKLNLIPDHDAIIAESKKWPIQMVCASCGLICAEGHRGVPSYLQSVGKQVTIEEQFNFSPLQIFKYNRRHLGGPLPLTSECVKIVSFNVRALLKELKAINLSNIEDFVCPFLFDSLFKNEYLSYSYEFELALIHVLLSDNSAVDLLKTTESPRGTDILAAYEPKVRKALETHQSIKDSIPDLNFDNRMKQILQLVNQLNIEGLGNAERSQKVYETITNFIIPKLNMKKFLLWSNEVVACALLCLGCTYCAFSQPCLGFMARRFDIMPGIIYSNYIIMGEDVSRADKS